MDASEPHRRGRGEPPEVQVGTALALAALVIALIWPPALLAGESSSQWRVAAAIETKTDNTAATGSIDTREPPPMKDELQANGVRAALRATRMGSPVPAGGTAFATILLTNESEAKSVAAEIVLDAEGSEIKEVTGGVAKQEGDGSSRVITVADINRKKSERVTVELLLKDTAQADAQKSNRLRITLRQPGAGSAADSTELSWQVVDCPGAYHGRLTQIREANEEAIAELLKSVQKPDRERAGRWLFTPSASASRQTCLKSERIHDRRSGRFFTRCLEYANEQPGLDAETQKLEGEVIRFAAPLVSRRTVDPELSVKRNAGWVSYKVGTDLRQYLTQPKSPALCTGVPAFIGYYQSKLGEVNKRIEMFMAKVEDAAKVARARVLHARETAMASAGGHPGWGAAPLTLTPPEPDASLKALAETLAAIAGNTPLQDSVASAQTAYEALKAFKDFFEGKDDESLPKDVAGAMLSALAAVEAADYVAAGAAPYVAIDRHIVGSLDAIGKAHAEHCVCSR